MITVLVEQKWEDSLLESIGPLVGAAIHEQVLASRVTMDVAIEKDIATFERLSHHHFCGTVLWELLHAWSHPLPIKIQATERCSIVSNNDSIGIKHRYDLENEIVSKVLRHLII